MADSAPINIGIVGLGFMAATHLRAYRQVPNARVVALCNPSGRHLDGDFSQVAGNVGSKDPVVLNMAKIKAYRQYSDLLADPSIQAIDICAPTHAHAELSIAALAAGKHVICEKPLARSVAIAREIVTEVKRNDLIFMPAMCMRFWPGWVELKEAITSNGYGKLLGLRFRRVAEPPSWGHTHFQDGARSGGALFDLHVHDTDFIQFCLGRPKAVFSSGYTKFSGAIDHVVTQYDYGEGLTVWAEGSWALAKGFGFSMSYTANFEHATLDFDLARNPKSLRIFHPRQEPGFIEPDLPGTDGYIEELRHFTAQAATGKASAVVTVHDALVTTEICEAEEQSVLSRQPVFL
ncbi:MAG: Gfo/Idh/MocA family oxidoreductase [Verrucomicrobiota bacterium]|nr:Gfo/Idh/MocA family oxidoreductase [Verrucomicrobiota bacterium]